MDNLGGIINQLANVAENLSNIYSEKKTTKNLEEYHKELIDALKQAHIASKSNEKKMTDEDYSKILDLSNSNNSLKDEIGKLNKEIDNNSKTIDKLNKEINKKGLSEDDPKMKLKQDLENKKTTLESKVKSNEVQIEKNQLEANKIAGKKVNLGRIQKLTAGIQLNESKGVAGLLQGGFGKINALKANPWMVAVSAAIKAVEFGINMYTKYLTTAGETMLRSYETGTQIIISTLSSNLTSMKDVVEGQYSSGKAQRENIAAATETINQNRLQWKKLKNQWTNWIPIWGQLNALQEAKMELEMKGQQEILKRANETLNIVADYQKLSEEYIKKQDSAIHNFQRATGMTLSQTNEMEKRLFAFGPRLANMFNKTIEDILKFQTEYIEQTGRNMNMSTSDYEKAMGMGMIVGDQNFTQFSSKMNLFNKSVSSSADIMFETYKSLGNMGLSQQKVVKSILNNMKMAEKYSFKNGVQGYIDMVKWAENFRVSLTSISTAINKMQQNSLEQVIQQSAKLQVLGGRFAMNSDPFAMYYESMTDAAEYAKRIVDSFKGYGTINKKTGETVFSGNERKMIMEASSAWGMNFEDVLNMIRESNKKNVVKSQLGTTKLSGDALDSVINKSYFDEDKGQWMVNTINGKPMAVADVGENDIQNIVGEEINDPLVNYAAKTFSLTENIEKTSKEIAAALGNADFEDYVKNVNESIDATKRNVIPNIPKITNSIESLRRFNIIAQKAMLKQNGDLDSKTETALNVAANFKENNNVASIALKSDDEIQELKKRIKKNNYTTNNKLTNGVMGLGAGLAIYGTYATATGLGAIPGAAMIGGGLLLNRIGSYFYNDLESDKKDLKEKVDEIYKAEIETRNELGEKLTEKEKKNLLNKYYEEAGLPQVKDGYLPNYGKPISVAANKVIPINDGQVTTAVSHPQDSALFAKTGGPFDTLFNGVFKKIDDTHQYVEHLPRNYSTHTSSETKTNTTNNGKFDLQIHGDINLKANGQSYNIMGQLEKDPMFVRNITELICQQLSVNKNGGKNRGLNNRPTF